jgi:phosphoribosylformylglycinamidine synthase
MTAFRATVTVMLKPVVNDPQGLTVRHGLHQLGFRDVQEVRVGKQIVVTMGAESQAAAERTATDMARRLLANSVIEDFSVAVEPVPESAEVGAPG